MFGKARKYFITGLFILLPFLVTLHILVLLFGFVDNLLGRFIYPLIGLSIPGLGMFLTLLIVVLVGILGTNIFTRKLLSRIERLFYNVPLLGTIYNTTKQIISSIKYQKKLEMSRLVLIEYPRHGIYSIAFVVGETKGEVKERSNFEMMNLFLPTTPNPAMGYLLFVPKKDIVPLPIAIEDGFKLLISGGFFTPKKEGKENADQ